MRGPTLFSILLTACFLAAPLHAEEWDAATMAIGWAHQDKDDSFTFFDEFSASLRTWSRDAGLLHNTPLGQMPVMPEKWVIDHLDYGRSEERAHRRPDDANRC